MDKSVYYVRGMSKKGYDRFDAVIAGRYGFSLSEMNKNEDETKIFKGRKFKIDQKYLPLIFWSSIALSILTLLLIVGLTP